MRRAIAFSFVAFAGCAKFPNADQIEDLRVLAFFSKPQVEQHWDIEEWPPDNSKVTGSPNRG